MGTKISTFFTLEEASFSSTALRCRIDNKIPDNILPAVKNTALRMDTVREFLNYPIHIDSWYRCLQLNRLLGSKDTSQHILGEAVDFLCRRFGSPFIVCTRISDSLLDFDKLILEHDWVHISWKANPSIKNRKLIYTLNKNPETNYEIPYLSGIVEQKV